jgi:hypothetical protein
MCLHGSPIATQTENPKLISRLNRGPPLTPLYHAWWAGVDKSAWPEHLVEDIEAAWEERPVIDAECFASFGDRACRLLAPLVPRPILRPWWPLVVERAKASHRLGLGIAQARHMLEGRLGLETLELPVIELVRLPTKEHRRHGRSEQRRVHRRDRQVSLRLRHPAPGAA